MKEDGSRETLSQEVIQKLVGKALLDVQAESAKYFDIFAAGLGEETTIAELAISAISKIKTVEVIILTTLRTIMKENGVPEGGTKFLNCVCKDIALVLMLLNELVSEADLLEVYEEEEVIGAIRAFREDLSSTETSTTNINDLAKDLKEFLGKAREAKDS